ncbi:MAG: LPS export ABC transporter periplasmic protein LptC, partial [bacterium]|nr:LPS export ABC transporter periplasmic protein LptC [bacterium]
PQRGAAGPPSPTARTAPSATLPPIQVSAKGNAKRPVVIESFRPHGTKRYRLEAQSATYDNAHRRASFRQTHVIFYREGKTLAVDAPKALIDHNTQTVTMDGGVRAVSSDGVVLTCRHLVYYSNTDHVSGDGDVRMVSGNDVLTGGHLDGDLHLEQVTVSP